MSVLKQYISGAPIAADASPNVTEPAADRILRTPVSKRSRVGSRVSLWLEDGTSATVSLWMKDPQMGVWILLQAGLAVASALTMYQSNEVVQDGVELFVQVTAAVGNPTNLATAVFT